MSDLLAALLEDLAAEGAELEAALDRIGWTAPTPAPGWTVATQIGHLLWTDEAAALAARAHESDRAKQAWDEVVLAALADPQGFVDASAMAIAQLPGGTVLERWRASRLAVSGALRDLPEDVRVPWFGPPMSATSMATARFMETWAHALDVYDSSGARPEPTDRIRHVAHLGVRTRDFAFTVHEEQPPAEEFRIELRAPSGARWTWGPEGAAQRVAGSAYDFCLLVTRRTHRDDTDLVAIGADAERWLEIAQAFAGPPGAGRGARP